MIKELAIKNRSYRRFNQEQKIKELDILDCIDTARYTASGANKQTLRYIVSANDNKNSEIFECLRWAGYYKDWDGPKEGERPCAYILIIGANDQNTAHDEGIVAQTILLSATEKGFGGCMIGNIDRQKLTKVIQIPDGYTIKLVIALGYPKEEVIIEDISKDESIIYYRDEQQKHHVPKIKTKDLIIENYGW